MQISVTSLYALTLSVLTKASPLQLFSNIVWAVNLSLLLLLIVHGPIYLFSVLVSALSSILDLSPGLTALQSIPLIVNPNVFIMSLYGFWRDDLDCLFLAGARYSDEYNKTDYYRPLVSLPEYNKIADPPHNSGWPLFSFRYQQLLKRYLLLYAVSAVAHFSSIYPSKLSTAILGWICFQSLTCKLGPFASFFLMAALNVVPHYYIAQTSIMICASTLLSHDLLLPFFNRVNFSPYEKQQWLNSRGGALLGFGIVIYYLVNAFPLLAVVTFALAQMAMGHFITKLSENIPRTTSKLLQWTPTQAVWSQQSAFAQGKFMEDLFIRSCSLF